MNIPRLCANPGCQRELPERVIQYARTEIPTQEEADLDADSTTLLLFCPGYQADDPDMSDSARCPLDLPEDEPPYYYIRRFGI